MNGTSFTLLPFPLEISVRQDYMDENHHPKHPPPGDIKPRFQTPVDGAQ